MQSKPGFKQLADWHNKQHRQQGVTLLLAILVLSSILAISFSLATILMVEIRSSGDLLKTEPSYYASQGVTEEMIYKIKRKTGVTIGATSIGPVNIASPVESSTSSPSQTLQVTGPKVYDTSDVRLNFFDASNPASDASMYGKVKITYLDTGNGVQMKVYLCQYDSSDFNPCVSGSSTIIVDSYQMTPGEIKEFTLNPNKRQELVLVNNTSNTMYAIVGSYASDGATPKGLPYVGETSVEIQATNSGLTRTLQTTIPTQ
jgi:hypothetical protein